MADRSRPDVNGIGTILALSSDGLGNPVTLYADPTTHALVVGSLGGSSFGGTFPTTGSAIGAKDDSTGLLSWVTSRNVNSSTQSLNVFVQNSTAGSPLGRVNLVDNSNSNVQGVSSTNEAFVGGGIASGVADTGNPVKIGGKASNSAPSAVSDGQRVNSWYGDNGQQFVALARDDGTKISTVNGAADAQSASNVGLVVGDYPFVFNGTTWDRVRSGPTTGSVLMSPPTAIGAAVPANAFYVAATDGSGNLRGLHVADGDSVSASATLIISPGVYNNSNMDRLRSATAAAGTTGTGVPASGTMVWDGTDFQLVKDTTARGDGDTTGYLGVGQRFYNGSSYDRAQSGGVTGMQGVSLQASPSGAYSFTNITTATTTLVKSGAGTLHAIIVNTPVLSGVIEMDNAITHTAPKIGTITYPATLVSDGPDSVVYDLAFSTGLSITTTGAMDITVVWK